jgi:DNA-binding IclR family transcriptional regulator
MGNYIIPNLSNACRVLQLVVDSSSGLTRDQISEALGVPRSTSYRILQTFLEERFLEYKEHRYFPGAGLYTLGLQLSSVDRLRPLVRPILHHLSATTGFTAHLAIPSGYKTLLLDVCDSQNILRVASRAGTVAPIHVSATGKVFLAYLFPDDIEDIKKEVGFERYTERTKISVENVRQDIQTTLMRGYALDDREFNDGVRCLAYPLFDLSGSVVAAIGVTSPVVQFPSENVNSVAEVVKEHARRCYKLLKNHG